METILIATDFSETSRNGSFYGVRLADALGARVVLLNVYPTLIPDAEAITMITAEELKEQSRIKLLIEIKAIDLNGGVAIEQRSEQGNAAEVILFIAKEINASWIVAGMKGGSRIERKIFGGAALFLSRHSTIPVILIPEFASFKVPGVLAVASDISHETDMHILDPLMEFGEKFSASMFIVRVIKKGMDEVIERLLRPSRINYHFRELHPSFQFLKDDDVAHAMNDFVKDNRVDMVVMVSQEHTLIERIFIKSNIKEMVLKTQIPLLVLPGKKSAKPAGISKTAGCCGSCMQCSKDHPAAQTA